MTTELLKEFFKQFPNFMGLAILAYVLWNINQQTTARLDSMVMLLVQCFTAQGVIR